MIILCNELRKIFFTFKGLNFAGIDSQVFLPIKTTAELSFFPRVNFWKCLRSVGIFQGSVPFFPIPPRRSQATTSFSFILYNSNFLLFLNKKKKSISLSKHLKLPGNTPGSELRNNQPHKYVERIFTQKCKECQNEIKYDSEIFQMQILPRICRVLNDLKFKF